MKRISTVLLSALLAVSLMAGCASNDSGSSSQQATESTPEAQAATPDDADAPDEDGEAPEDEPAGNGATITVGATPTPHAEILQVAKPILEAKGYTLNIMEFNDYVQPNRAVNDGEIDANYFQHQPHLDKFNDENNGTLIPMVAVHYEPLGIYPGKTSSLEELADGAQVAVPNDPSNEARALLLLEANGLITLKEGVGVEATVRDIVDNPKDLKILEIEAAQLPRSLGDVDIAVINGNYALQADLNAADDALAKEEKDSPAAQEYANVLAVRDGDETREELIALVEALSSDEVKAFIADKYQGAVVSSLD